MDNLFLVQLKIRYININHNIIILISSYPFISLMNCPWLLFHGIILLSFYCIFFDFLISCRIITMILLLLTFIYYWIRDVVREAVKKYEVLPAGLFIVFLIFVFSEGMLFLSFFWASFHSSLTDMVEEGLYVPDLCELTYTNTLLLSNAALSLGCAKIHKENNHGNSIDYSFILAWAFITLQIKEFRNLAFYINDSIFGSVFFFLTGLHFFHVIVGIILIGIILCIISLPQRILPFHLYYNLQLIYWHFIELLWIFIYIILYSY